VAPSLVQRNRHVTSLPRAPPVLRIEGLCVREQGAKKDEKQLMTASALSSLPGSSAAVSSVACDEGNAYCIEDQRGHHWVQPHTPRCVVEDECCEGDDCEAQRQAERVPFDRVQVSRWKEGLYRGVSGKEDDEEYSQHPSYGNQHVSCREEVDHCVCGDGRA